MSEKNSQKNHPETLFRNKLFRNIIPKQKLFLTTSSEQLSKNTIQKQLFRKQMQTNYSEKPFRKTVQDNYSENIFRKTIQKNYPEQLFRKTSQNN